MTAIDPTRQEVDAALKAAIHERASTGDMVPLSYYSAALDEIYRLRGAIAYEADVVDAHIGYKTFPKTRRMIALRQMERMREAARGWSRVSYMNMGNDLRQALRRMDAPETLTRAEFERTLTD